MTPNEKIAYIEAQVKELRRGLTHSIRCPYCNELNVEDQHLCCATFNLAVMAILDREDAQDGIEIAEKAITNQYVN
jgi:hypothetical protein